MTEQNNSQAEQAPAIQYDIPEPVDTFSLDLDGVSNEIDKLNSDMLGDPKHPAQNKNHPLSKQYKARRTQLYEHRENLMAELPDELETARQERADKNQREQDIRIKLAKIEMEKLGKLGFDTAEIPADISEIQCQLLKAETQYAKGKYLEGDQITMDIARKLKISSSKMQAYYDLRNASESKDAKKTVANQITFLLNAEHKKQRKALVELKAEIKTKVENPKKRFRYL